MPPRVVHLHIPKTAGTAVNSAIAQNYDPKRVLLGAYEQRLRKANAAKYDFFAGHVGFEMASALDAQIVCLLREPVDRFLSVYYFWRHLRTAKEREQRGPILAAALPLEEFVERLEETVLVQEFYNRVTWQIAYSYSLLRRRELSTEVTLSGVLETAKANLSKMAVVGFQHDMPDFVAQCRDKLGLTLDMRQLNVTPERQRPHEIGHAMRRRIENWLHLDMELYATALSRR